MVGEGGESITHADTPIVHEKKNLEVGAGGWV